MENQLLALLACVFPGCEAKITPAQAQVPEMAAIRQAEGKSHITPADIARHAHCPAHTELARRNGIKMYQYLGTVQELERRIREKEAAKGHFAKYSLPPKPETAVSAKLRQSGWTSEEAKAVLKPQAK